MLNEELKLRYRELDWERLLRPDLGNSGQITDAKPILDRIKKIFDKILNNPIVNSFPQATTNRIESILRSFLDFLRVSILSFSDVSLRQAKIEEIRAKEIEIVDSLGNLIPYLSSNEEKANVNVDQIRSDFEEFRKECRNELNEVNSIKNGIPEILVKLQSSIDLSNKLEQNSETINTGIARAKEWIAKNNEAVEVILKNNSSDAYKKSQEHITFKLDFVEIWLFKKIPLLKRITQPSFSGTFVWIVASMIWGLVVMGIIAYFVYLREQLTVGTVILRISSILVPAYFTIFCAQQYLGHKQLYEFYCFKNISLQNMINLRKQITGDTDSQRAILKKSLDVIFSEPILKNDIKYDKQLVSQLIEMLKR